MKDTDNVIYTPVPDCVQDDEFLAIVKAYTDLFCNVFHNTHSRNTQSGFNSEIYVASLRAESKSYIAVINTCNLSCTERVTLKTFMTKYHKNACVMCADDLPRYSNNAEPLMSGKCCDSCNQAYVIPYRIQGHLMNAKKKQKNSASNA